MAAWFLDCNDVIVDAMCFKFGVIPWPEKEEGTLAFSLQRGNFIVRWC